MILRVLVAIKLMLSHPRIVFGKQKSAFKPLELKLLTELESRVLKEYAEIVRAQLSEINFIERVSCPKTIISFNKVKGCSYDLHRMVKFPQLKEEYVLAKIDFKIKKKSYRAVFYVVFGNLFSIEFTADMSDLLEEKNVEF